MLHIDFRDWKYMSHYKRYYKLIQDKKVLDGRKEGKLKVKFSKMAKQDAQAGSKFEVGGRMFFEATVFNNSMFSHVTNGFLDK